MKVQFKCLTLGEEPNKHFCFRSYPEVLIVTMIHAFVCYMKILEIHMFKLNAELQLTHGGYIYTWWSCSHALLS